MASLFDTMAQQMAGAATEDDAIVRHMAPPASLR